MEISVNETKKIAYPCLMVSEDGVIILFTDKNTGTLLSQPLNMDIGLYSDDWGIEYFKPFTGSITLSND